MDTRSATAIKPDFRDRLEALFDDCFVVRDFMYKGLPMDYAVITTDRLIEVRHVTTRAEYASELSMIGRAGRFTFKKHKSIREGKFISNAFYFMCPSRILIADEMPPKYGLILYNAEEVLTFKKEADWINPEEYLGTSFYKTLAQKLAAELYSKK